VERRERASPVGDEGASTVLGCAEVQAPPDASHGIRSLSALHHPHFGVSEAKKAPREQKKNAPRENEQTL